MKKIFTILLILAIVGLGLAKPPSTEDTLPPINQLQIQPLSGSPFDILNNLTVPCQDAILAFFGNASACLPINDIIALMANLNTTGINKFAGQICPVPRCNDTILKLGKDLISQGCAADIQNKQMIPPALLTVVSLYPQLMEILCFNDSTNSSFCLADTLGIIDNLQDPNPPILKKGLDKVLFGSPAALCTECNQRISRVIALEIIPFISTPAHNDTKALLLGLLNIDESQLIQLPGSIMIKCGFQFLLSNNFTDICQQPK
ncbi:12947_t:CDS:2 [Dentiscutata erythropus]|uniref:12947_t:CDS:1 n=1 Tax=Dentiscutata erythropus TaxID=1348616 RepID=A0A9N9AD03_9GLOM|nr:12947_t:CDS:2 [Dentiscutata erythropus]